jgi:hypothetical protein
VPRQIAVFHSVQSHPKFNVIRTTVLTNEAPIQNPD